MERETYDAFVPHLMQEHTICTAAVKERIETRVLGGTEQRRNVFVDYFWSSW